jgi:hypothetical protein
VPGLVKHTSTPPATRVRTRLSAPFIRSTPVRQPHDAEKALPSIWIASQNLNRKQDLDRKPSQVYEKDHSQTTS